MKFHFIRERVRADEIKLYKCWGSLRLNVADALTKSLPRPAFHRRSPFTKICLSWVGLATFISLSQPRVARFRPFFFFGLSCLFLSFLFVLDTPLFFSFLNLISCLFLNFFLPQFFFSFSSLFFLKYHGESPKYLALRTSPKITLQSLLGAL